MDGCRDTNTETRLSDLIEWDSIASLSFIAMIDEEFDKIIKAEQIKKFRTVADAVAVMER